MRPPVVDGKKLEGNEVILNRWWLEGDPVESWSDNPLAQNPNPGVVPSYYAFSRLRKLPFWSPSIVVHKMTYRYPVSFQTIKEDGAEYIAYNGNPEDIRPMPEGSRDVSSYFYDVTNSHLLKIQLVSPNGVLQSENYAFVKQKPAQGLAGVITKGTEYVFYDFNSSFMRPVVAKKEEGQVTKKWTGYRRYEEGNGLQAEVQSYVESEPTAPEIKRTVEAPFIDGVPTPKKRVGHIKAMFESFKDSWYVFLFPIILATVFGLIAFVYNSVRLLRKQGQFVRAGAGRRHPAAGPRAAARPQQAPTSAARLAAAAAIAQPSFGDYGFDRTVVVAARKNWKAVSDRLEAGVPVNRIIGEYMEYYAVWYTNMRQALQKVSAEDLGRVGLPADYDALLALGLENPLDDQSFTLEDVWLFHLMFSGSAIIFHVDEETGFMPYLLHTARRMSRGTASEKQQIGPMIRTQAARWHKILFNTQAKNKGLLHGGTSNIVAYQFLFFMDDLDDMFRIPLFVIHYDDLRSSGRDEAAYDQALTGFLAVSDPLLAKIGELVKKYQPDKLTVKRLIRRTKEYRDYIRAVELYWSSGRWKADDPKGLPLFFKTYPDTVGMLFGERGGVLGEIGWWVGGALLFVTGLGGWLTWSGLGGWLHVIRNSFGPFSIVSTNIVLSALAAFVVTGTLTLPAAAIWLGIWVTGMILVKVALDIWLNRQVLTRMYGKPFRPDQGWAAAPVSIGSKLFSWGFWTVQLGSQFLWNHFLFTKFNIPNEQFAGSDWEIFGFNASWAILPLFWSSLLFMTFVVIYSFYHWSQSIGGFIQAKSHGIGLFRSREDLVKAAQTVDFRQVIRSKLGARLAQSAQRSGIPFDQFITETLYKEDLISFAESQGDLTSFEDPFVQKRMERFLSSLYMDLPEYPSFDKIHSLTTGIPVGPAETLIYGYKDIDSFVVSGTYDSKPEEFKQYLHT
ncbi:MAG: hypothetical protein WCG06_02775, partial [Candidatus Omnitrophota bacterium]